MSARNATTLLAFVGVARGSSFLFSKMLLQGMEPFMLLAWRFLLALPIIAIVFHAHLRQIDGRTFVHGVLLGLLCTVFGFTFQPVAQRYLNAQASGMLCATNPLTAAVLGTVVLGESATLLMLIGMVLIVGGIVSSSIVSDKESQQAARNMRSCGINSPEPESGRHTE